MLSLNEMKALTYLIWYSLPWLVKLEGEVNFN